MKENIVTMLLVLTAINTYAEDLPVIEFSKHVNDTLEKAPTNWFHLDPKDDKINGISTDKTYKELLKGKKSNTVIVAVIDSGIDIDHEDLVDVIWTNEDEISGNGIDDDKNGYVDDVHGWNFIGGKEGNVEKDTYEITREYGRLLQKYKTWSATEKEADEEYAYFQKIEKEYTKTVEDMETKYQGFKGFYEGYKYAKRLLLAYLDADDLNLQEVLNISSTDEKINSAKQIMKYIYESNIDEDEFEKGNEYFDVGLNYGYNLSYNSRLVVGDNYDDPYEKNYGNNDVKGEFNFHGTHVAGIIGANRINEIGVKGIANNVKIMAIRAVPNGDERDKDIANAIRYAVDNGAQVINMSFGKSYSPQKSVVDDAVSYAEKNGVLLVHAAGNSSKNIDVKDNFPTQVLKSGQLAGNWLEVGAMSWGKGDKSVADFSNYGKNSVDIFAPGVDILSTAPELSYEEASGTSMAAPVTTGIAAILFSYYPSLSPKQVKEIIVQSSVKHNKLKVLKPGSKDEVVPFSDLSRTGGVVNLFEAVKLAQKVARNKKKLKAF